MAVRTQCPRCKQPLSVPNKLAGSYASCPRCQGRFWVSKDAPPDPPAGDSVGGPPAATLTLTNALPIATPPAAAGTRLPRRHRFRRGSTSRSVTPLAPAPAPTPAPSLPVPAAAGQWRTEHAADREYAMPGRPPQSPQGRAARNGRYGPIDFETGRRWPTSATPTPGGRQERQGAGQFAIGPPPGHDRGLDLLGGGDGCHRAADRQQ